MDEEEPDVREVMTKITSLFVFVVVLASVLSIIFS